MLKTNDTEKQLLAARKKQSERHAAWRLANPEKAKENNRAWNKAHPAEAKKYNQEWQKKNKEERNKRRREWHAKNPEKAKEYHNKRLYNLSAEVYQAMLQDQNNLCASCGAEKKLQVDHDHKTGQVRGLLCGDCNVAAGRLKDSSKLATKLLKYLKKFE